MDLAKVDATKLIQEAYRIDGISASECRSIFLDWALKLPSDIDQVAAMAFLLETLREDPAHPMSQILVEGQKHAKVSGRRGGRAARLGQTH